MEELLNMGVLFFFLDSSGDQMKIKSASCVRYQ